MRLVDFSAGAFEAGVEFSFFDFAAFGDAFDQGFFVWRKDKDRSQLFFQFIEVSFVEGFLDLDQALDIQFFDDRFSFFQSVFNGLAQGAVPGGLMDLGPFQEIAVVDVGIEFLVGNEVVGISLRFSRAHFSGGDGLWEKVFGMTFPQEVDLGAFADAGRAEE